MLTIEAISAFDDNYIWCLYDTESLDAIVVDPGEAGPVVAFLNEKQLTLTAVWVTHHHSDHIGGINSLKTQYNCGVYGPSNPSIKSIDKTLTEGDTVNFKDCTFQVLEIPGHTLDHLAFYCQSVEGTPRLFCGDTLFAGGCGRIFEGTPHMMYQSLNKLAQLPQQTLVYCAHEYTLANLDFAIAVEPLNRNLQKRIITEQQKRSANKATLPSTIGLELDTNPFLRCTKQEVANSAMTHKQHNEKNEIDTFATLREWKNIF